MMRRSLVRHLIAVALPLILVGPLRADQLRNVQRGELLPPFNLAGLEGQPVKSADLSGKVLVLVYVSARQRQSEEVFASAHRVVERLNRDDVELVYISADADQADYFRELRDRLTAREPMAFDGEREYYGKLGLIVYPTTVVTSKDGKLLHVVTSWTRDYEYRLELYCRHAAGEINDAELSKRATAGPLRKDKARIKADRHRSVATVYRSKGMADEAIRELEQAIAADPTYADVVVDLVEVLVSRGKIDEAEKRADVLLKDQPDCNGAKLMLGLIRLKRGDLDAAETLLKEELTLNPDPIRANYYLGQLYEQKGDHKLAMQHYRDALKRALKEQ